jgi:hypothetical protein
MLPTPTSSKLRFLRFSIPALKKSAHYRRAISAKQARTSGVWTRRFRAEIRPEYSRATNTHDRRAGENSLR